MDLFNKSGVLVSSVLVLIGALIACQAQEDAVPPPTVIEAAALQLGPHGDGAAERRLQEWADQGSPVAQRELALRYLANPAKRSEAMRLFERAARAGDVQAANGLVAMYREASALNGPSSVNELSASRLMTNTATSAYALH
jgi:TPR repeat protein